MSTKEKVKGHDVFISYRRAGGGMLARLIYETLKQRRYSVFFDYESLTAGRFSEEIVETIHGAKDVLVILSNGCLERCKDPSDWVYREISEAFQAKRNVIPVFAADFIMPKEEELETYPQEIKDLFEQQGGQINIEHFDSVIEKILGYMNSKPRAFSEEEIQPIVQSLFNGGIDKLTVQEKNEFVTQIFKSRYGDDLAGIVASFVDSTTNQYKNIRKSFNYEIEIGEAFPFREIEIDEDKYFKLSERLSYEKYFLGEAIGGNFLITFDRNLDMLDKELKDETILFSENLLMNYEDLQKLIELSDEEKLEFYCKNMRVKLNLNKTVYTPSKVTISEGGIVAYYEAKDIYPPDGPKVLDFKISFSLPHRKAASYFFVSINDPTYSPFIRFTYPEEVVDVQMIPFLNRATTAEDSKVFDGERELSFKGEWVLPMSGAVFIVTLDAMRIE